MNVSVVVLTYNEEANIARCLSNLTRQETRDFAIEILVVDQGSTDATLAIVRDFISGDARIHAIASGKNSLGLARRVGVAVARFPLVAFIDADCVAPPTWLASLRHTLVKSCPSGPSVFAGVGSSNVPPHAPRSALDVAVATMRGSFVGHLNSPQMRSFSGCIEVEHIPTASALFWRRALLAAGNFSARFERVCEDVEMGVRMRRRGWRLLLQSEPAVEHFRKPGWYRWARTMAIYGWGQSLVVREHADHLSWRLLLPLLVVAYHVAIGAAITFLRVTPLVLLFYPAAVALVMVFALQSRGCTMNSPALTRSRVSVWAITTLATLLTHFCYALGESAGITILWIHNIRALVRTVVGIPRASSAFSSGRASPGLGPSLRRSISWRPSAWASTIPKFGRSPFPVSSSRRMNRLPTTR